MSSPRARRPSTSSSSSMGAVSLPCTPTESTQARAPAAARSGSSSSTPWPSRRKSPPGSRPCSGNSASSMLARSQVSSMALVDMGSGLLAPGRAGLALVHHDQLLHREVQPLGVLDQVAIERFVQGGGAGQDPQVVAVGAGHQRPLVVVVQGQHVVAAIEGAEEAHLEAAHALVADEVGAPLRLADLLVGEVHPAVEYPHAAVVAQEIIRNDALEAALEGVVEPGDLVPLAQVAVELEAGDRLGSPGDAGAAGQQQGGTERGNQGKAGHGNSLSWCRRM